MNLQWAGPILALTTFVAIGAGHVMVRRFHARYGTRPAIVFFICGALALLGSLLAGSNLVSAVIGVTAITLLWDGVEMYRQEKRMRREKSGAGDQRAG